MLSPGSQPSPVDCKAKESRVPRMRGWMYPRLIVRIVRLSLLLCVALLSCRTMHSHETGFLIRTVVVGGTTYPYSVYVPLGFDESKSWPVILFLHGSGERGMDGLRPTQIGVAAAIRANPGRVPAGEVFSPGAGGFAGVRRPVGGGVAAPGERHARVS